MAIDLTKICRVCLESSEETFDIFNSCFTKWNITYADVFWKYTSIKPTKEDGLPHTICKSCTKALKRTLSFNIQCEESNQKLKCLIIIPKPEPKEYDAAEAEMDNKTNFEDTYKIVNAHENEGSDDGVDTADEPQVYNEDLEELEENALNLTPIQEFGQEFKHEIKELIESVDKALWDPEDEVILNNIKSNKIDDKLKQETKSKKGPKNVKKIEDADYVPEKKKKNKEKKKEPLYQCDICGKVTTTNGNLKQHRVAHLANRVFQCPECPNNYKTSSHLKVHLRLHTGERPYACEHCGKTFARRTGFAQHCKIHTGEKRYKCEICQKRFIQSGQLAIHMKRHSKEKPFLCQTCGKGFPLRSELAKHERIHSGEKPYACPVCGKTFATLGNLSIHNRIHTRKARKTCEVCGKEFLTTSSYSVHMKRHKNIRNYICDCGKKFYTASCLKSHKYTHTGERRFQCKICDRTFGQSSHLGRHFRKDHAKPSVTLPPSSFYMRKLDLSGKNEAPVIPEKVKEELL